MSNTHPHAVTLPPTPPDAAQQPALLSRRKAAAYLAISTRTLWSLTEAKRIRCIRIGGRLVRYAVADLDAFIASCRGGER